MKAYAKTDIGKKRSMNQDYFYCSNNPVGSFQNLLIAADGMGGHKAGDHASKLCVENIVKSISSNIHSTPVTVFNEAIMAANKVVYEEARRYPQYEGMGTTVVACTLLDKTLYVANIGDSRLYLISDEIKQVTSDHSLVEEMVKKGDITEREARVHPQKNIITRALGIDDQVHADYFEISVETSDIVLLCTDGLTNMIEDDDIEYIVKHSGSIEKAVNSLVAKANENGGYDNITVILAVVN